MQEFFDKNNFKKKFNVWEEIIKLPIGYIKLDIDFPADQFLDECLALKDKAKTFSFTRYQKFDKEEPGWTGLALAENEDVSFRSISYNLAPKLSAWFKECGLFNFSNAENDKIHIHFLEPGASIPIHRDYEDNNLSGINFAVTQPQGCKFLVDEYGEIPFEKKIIWTVRSIEFLNKRLVVICKFQSTYNFSGRTLCPRLCESKLFVME